MKNDYLPTVKLRLKNTLKGHAYMIISENESMSTKQEKLDKLNIIEDFLHYIDNYENNIKLLNEIKIEDMEH